MVPVIQGATVPIVVRGASEERVSKSTRKQESLTRKENTIILLSNKLFRLQLQYKLSDK
jgi:hypothetical protein